MRTALLVLGGLLVSGTFVLWGCHERRTRMVVGREGPPDAVIVERRPTEMIVVREAPPPHLVEVIPSPPSRSHSWIPGYYTHRGSRYEWVGGHYAVPPRPGARWERDTWSHTDRGWKYVPGRWR